MLVAMQVQTDRMKRINKHQLSRKAGKVRVSISSDGQEPENSEYSTRSRTLVARRDSHRNISAEDRKLYHMRFLSKASEEGTITLDQLFDLLGPNELNVCERSNELEAQIRRLLGTAEASLDNDSCHFSYDFFVSLISCAKQWPRTTTHPFEGEERSLNKRKPYLPFDPDSTWKLCWDLFCLFLLLYCSFSVPYGIAFLIEYDESIGTLEISSLAVDSVFMIDILFSFLTAVEMDGVMVRDLKVIARIYVRSWFIADFAGSFPFDTVISSAMESQSRLNSSNFLRFLKIIRMLKLIRAIKFMNKMNKLKQQEGFEVREGGRIFRKI
jgi:hypothetical protein